jgi:Na+/H+ antiporter NhaD/arsenite permease-like protein
MEHTLNLTHTWVGWAVLAIFVIGYILIATEERWDMNKAKPALFIGTFSFMLIGIYYYVNHLDINPLHHQLKELIEEIAEIFFFLFVAMTYIESLIERGVFDALRYRLISRGYSYKKLFWITGTLAFWISPVADNLTTALILSTVLFTIDKTRINFLVPGAINIVVAANAGGAWSPFGDITTLMAWTAGKGEIIDFLALFPAAFLGWLLTAWLLSLFVPKGEPHFDVFTTPKGEIKKGGKVVIFLGFFTIFIAVFGHIVMHYPAMWGMMFGLSLLQLYAYYHKRRHKEHFNVFINMSKVENDTLLFFFGILSAVGALSFLGWLVYVVKLYDIMGATAANIGVGFVSAIIDNVPVMAAILKADPQMGHDQWMLVTLTAGIGGSLISFGSAAGVGVMGRMRGIYTFNSHMKYGWTVLAGYILSCAIWYVQFEMLGLY